MTRSAWYDAMLYFADKL